MATTLRGAMLLPSCRPFRTISCRSCSARSRSAALKSARGSPPLAAAAAAAGRIIGGIAAAAAAAAAALSLERVDLLGQVLGAPLSKLDAAEEVCAQLARGAAVSTPGERG